MNHSSFLLLLSVSGHIGFRNADYKQALGLVYPQYTTHEIMTNRNIIQRGTQTTSLDVVIALDSQLGGPDRHPALVGCSHSRYTINGVSNHPTLIQEGKKWIREDNKHVFYCYIKRKPTQRGYEKKDDRNLGRSRKI